MHPNHYAEIRAVHSGSCRLRAPDAATYLGLSQSTLAKMRLRGDGPAYAKAGRAVIYDRGDLDSWLERLKRKSTSEIPLK
jgi:predicted DNA-binding transcriptional regulator AlpA